MATVVLVLRRQPGGLRQSRSAPDHSSGTVSSGDRHRVPCNAVREAGPMGCASLRHNSTVEPLFRNLFDDLGLMDPDGWSNAAHAHVVEIEMVTAVLGPQRMRHLLCTRGLRYPQLRIVDGGDELPVEAYSTRRTYRRSMTSGWIDPERATRAWSAGGVLVFQSVHQYDASAARVHAALRKLLRFEVRLNVYVAPPHCTGLGLHHDGHDVLIVQLDGVRTWSHHRATATSGLETRPPMFVSDPSRYAALVAELPCSTIRMERGDVLFLPAGSPHMASTGAEPSTHLTISIHRPSVGSVALQLASNVAAGGDLDQRLPALRSEPIQPMVMAASAELAARLTSSIDGISDLDAVIGDFEPCAVSDEATEPLLFAWRPGAR